tara:strand:- start:215 stop:427 length:213 start_codon:yes stop_codon:yes gene_type:complete
MSKLTEILEEHQQTQRKFILVTSDDVEHTLHADNLLALFKEIQLSFMNRLGYYLDDFVSLEEITNDGEPA